MNAIELRWRKNGYDAGFIKDEFDCNLDKCECAHFNQTIIGNFPSFSKTLTQKNHSGDIAVSEQTFHKLLNISDDSNVLWRAYSKSNLDLWNQNFVNGEYIIAFELGPQLHYKIRRMLPLVGLRLTFKNIPGNIVFFVIFGRNLYWESVNKHWQSLAPSLIKNSVWKYFNLM